MKKLAKSEETQCNENILYESNKLMTGEASVKENGIGILNINI